MSQTTQSIGDYVRGVVVSASASPTERTEKQRTVIREYRRVYPDKTLDEVFADLSRINRDLFSDGDHVQGAMTQVIKPRLMKLPGASDQQNAAAAEKLAIRALVALHTKSYPTASWNQMFEDLGKKHPDVFNDPSLITPEDDI